MMRTLICILLIIPLFGFSQLPDKDFYLSPRFAIGNGLSEYTYRSNLDGTSADTPKSVKLDIGSGFIPELALGVRLKKYLFVELSYAQLLNTDYYETIFPTGTEQQGFEFNRGCIALSAKSFYPVNERFMLDFSLGATYYIPQDLTIKLYGVTEEIPYVSSVGLQGSFGAGYLTKNWYFSGGLRYRLETYSIKANSPLPNDFNNLNPEMDFLVGNGIDIVVSALYYL